MSDGWCHTFAGNWGAGQEVLLTRGDQVRDFLDVKDAARMIADVALGQQQGAVNICSGDAVTV